MSKTSRVLITGTPSVGKTTIAKEVAKTLNYYYVDVAKVIIERQMYVEVDSERGSFIVDVGKARRFFSSLLKKLNNAVLDTHIVELFPKRLIDKVIVLRVHPLLILKRGVERGWSLKKSLENAQAELLGVCFFDSLSFYGKKKVWQVNCTCRPIEQVVSEVLSILEGKRRGEDIDWLKELEREGKLDLLLELEKARDLSENLFEFLRYCR
ncbi:MAG: adenylate kinase family protein [Candidatus Nezhaarchaeota archaeon]|nr:adenylate kinase family protein [Candidatus Nezhaarchaeota archaeon]